MSVVPLAPAVAVIVAGAVTLNLLIQAFEWWGGADRVRYIIAGRTLLRKARPLRLQDMPGHPDHIPTQTRKP